MSSAKKRVIISACLLGEYCRYDGKTKVLNTVIKAYKEYEIIPFCPEDPLFGTPRERINVVEVNGENRIITEITNMDVTLRLEEEINAFCAKHHDIDAIVLKSKSPSCGYKTTPIINKEKIFLHFGSGIASTILSKKYPNIKIENEIEFEVK